MNARKTVKKIVALASGAAMVGATVMGAMAYNLADYPTPFVTDGVANAKIVVGEKAATQDVLGAIDIAASLQAASVTKEAVDIPGVAGEVVLEGDVFRMETGSDLLEIREAIGDVYDTLTNAELEALRGGQITTDEGSTDYNQYVRFAESTSTTLQPMAVNYKEDENNVLGDYLVIDDEKPFFEWEIEFTEGLESATTGGQLEDLEDEVFNIFGTDFTFVDSTIVSSGSSAGSVVIEFMAGDVSSTMREGETKTFTIDGVEYEVTLIFVSDPNTGTPEAKFMVNGEVTDSLTDGDTDTLSGGLQIGVRDLLVNSREGVVEFFLGANKVEFTDTTTSSESFNGRVEIGNENIEDASLSIVGTFTTSTNGTWEVTSMKYRLTADANTGSTIYVPPGSGVREFLDEPEGLLSPSFDIRYEGLKDVTRYPIEVEAQSDHSYDLTIANLRGKEFTFPLATNKASAGAFKWGDDDDDFYFTEAPIDTSGGSIYLNATAADFWISDDDYFVVSEGNTVVNDRKDDSAVMQYDDIDTSDRIIYFTDVSTGEQKTVSYTVDTTGPLDIGVASNFVVEGNTYTVYVNLNDTAYNLTIDLDGNGTLGGEVTFTTKGGGILDFSNETQVKGAVIAADTSFRQTLTTPAAQFDGSAGSDSFYWDVSTTGTNEVTLSASGSAYTGVNANSANTPWGDFDLENDDQDDDYDRGLTDYGAWIEYYAPSGSNDANELTIMYPETQMGAQVFVVAGSTSRTESAGGVSTEVVNPIAVGLAVLDTNAPPVGSENMIVVGGPCANMVASRLLGNPAVCGEGFVPGKAMIKAFDTNGKVAVLVAGYEAQDTLGASYVLANYGDYGLSGSEASVTVADLNTITVNTVE